LSSAIKAIWKELGEKRMENGEWRKEELILNSFEPVGNADLRSLQSDKKQIFFPNICSIAKREEEIFLPGQKVSIMLEK